MCVSSVVPAVATVWSLFEVATIRLVGVCSRKKGEGGTAVYYRQYATTVMFGGREALVTSF